MKDNNLNKDFESTKKYISVMTALIKNNGVCNFRGKCKYRLCPLKKVCRGVYGFWTNDGVIENKRVEYAKEYIREHI